MGANAKAADRVIWVARGWQPSFIGFCPSEAAWKREAKRLKHNEPYPTTAGRCCVFEEGGKRCIIVTLADGIEDRLKHVEVIGLIVHEATHVLQFVLEKMDERNPSPEFEAYSMQAIVQNLYQAWSETRGCRRKKPV